jgi:heptaprenyl diphosphate synthase
LVAIVAGDFLLARSAEIAASLGSEVAGLLASTLGLLCQGQVAEVKGAYDVNRGQDDYFTAIAGKTAALMSTSCRIGALTGNLGTTEVEALTTFGHCVGMVYQLRDDVLDVIGTEQILGKPAGQDLAEGIYTLPVLIALEDPVTGPELRSVLGKPLGLTDREHARAIVASGDAIEQTVAKSQVFVAEAATAANTLDDPVLARALVELVDSMLGDLPVAQH